jgi:hypothetical protein
MWLGAPLLAIILLVSTGAYAMSARERHAPTLRPPADRRGRGRRRRGHALRPAGPDLPAHRLRAWVAAAAVGALTRPTSLGRDHRRPARARAC